MYVIINWDEKGYTCCSTGYTFSKCNNNNLKAKLYAELKIRELLYFMESKSISGVTSRCRNTCTTPVGHTGVDTWRSHPLLTWIPYILCVK